MKKYLLFLPLMIVIVPSVVFASWWNPVNWFGFTIVKVPQNGNNVSSTSIQNSTKNSVPQPQVVIKTNASVAQTPVTKTSQLQVKESVQNLPVVPAQKTIPVVQKPASNSDLAPAHVLSFNYYVSSVNYNNFQIINSSDYIKNPGAYLNRQIEIKSLTVDDFIQTSNGGYIDLWGENNGPNTPEEIMLKVDGSSDYQEIVNDLNKYDTINVFGLGLSNQQINQVNEFRSVSLSYPALSVQRIDRGHSTIFAKTIPQDQGTKLNTGAQISLSYALQNSTLYSTTNFSTQGVIKGFEPFDNKGNYNVLIADPDNPNNLAYVLVEGNSKNQLQVGNTIEISGHFRYSGASHLDIDTQGSPIKIVR